MATKERLLVEAFRAIEEGVFERAKRPLEKYLKQTPLSFEANLMMGICLGVEGDHWSAVKHFRRAVTVKPGDSNARFNLAKALHESGELLEALAEHHRALKLDPENPEIFQNLGMTLLELKRFEEARDAFQSALVRSPENAELLSNLGVALDSLGQESGGEPFHARASELDPYRSEIWSNFGLCLQKQGRLEEARRHYDRALQLNPESKSGLLNRSTLFNEIRDNSAALNDIDRLIALDPSNANAWMNRSKYLRESGCFEDGFLAAEKALSLNPADPDLHFTLSFFLLSKQDFPRGWAEYRWRWEATSVDESYPKTHLQVWSGNSLDSLILIAEQGLGEQVMYLTMLEELMARVKNLRVSLSRRLLPVFKQAFPGVTFCSKDEEIPENLDAHITMGDLPAIFRSNPEHFPQHVNCLEAYFRGRTPSQSVRSRGALPLVGLSWKSTNPTEGRKKSVPLQELLPAVEKLDCELLSLQYGDISVDLASTSGSSRLLFPDFDVTNELLPLFDQIYACDVLVTCSGTTAHFAGILGKPVYLLLPFAEGKFWYWAAERAGSSLWYPTIKILRQEKPWDWSAPLSKLSECLAADFANAKPGIQ